MKTMNLADALKNRRAGNQPAPKTEPRTDARRTPLNTGNDRRPATPKPATPPKKEEPKKVNPAVAIPVWLSKDIDKARDEIISVLNGNKPSDMVKMLITGIIQKNKDVKEFLNGNYSVNEGNISETAEYVYSDAFASETLTAFHTPDSITDAGITLVACLYNAYPDMEDVVTTLSKDVIRGAYYCKKAKTDKSGKWFFTTRAAEKAGFTEISQLQFIWWDIKKERIVSVATSEELIRHFEEEFQTAAKAAATPDDGDGSGDSGDSGDGAGI